MFPTRNNQPSAAQHLENNNIINNNTGHIHTSTSTTTTTTTTNNNNNNNNNINITNIISHNVNHPFNNEDPYFDAVADAFFNFVEENLWSRNLNPIPIPNTTTNNNHEHSNESSIHHDRDHDRDQQQQQQQQQQHDHPSDLTDASLDGDIDASIDGDLDLFPTGSASVPHLSPSFCLHYRLAYPLHVLIASLEAFSVSVRDRLSDPFDSATVHHETDSEAMRQTMMMLNEPAIIEALEMVLTTASVNALEGLPSISARTNASAGASTGAGAQYHHQLHQDQDHVHQLDPQTLGQRHRQDTQVSHSTHPTNTYHIDHTHDTNHTDRTHHTDHMVGHGLRPVTTTLPMHSSSPSPSPYPHPLSPQLSPPSSPLLSSSSKSVLGSFMALRCPTEITSTDTNTKNNSHFWLDSEAMMLCRWMRLYVVMDEVNVNGHGYPAFHDDDKYFKSLIAWIEKANQLLPPITTPQAPLATASASAQRQVHEATDLAHIGISNIINNESAHTQHTHYLSLHTLPTPATSPSDSSYPSFCSELSQLDNLRFYSIALLALHDKTEDVVQLGDRFHQSILDLFLQPDLLHFASHSAPPPPIQIPLIHPPHSPLPSNIPTPLSIIHHGWFMTPRHRILALVRYFKQIGDYQEVVPVLVNKNVASADIAISLLRRFNGDMAMTEEILVMINACLTHRIFALTFIERNGLDVLFQLPQTPYLAGAFAICVDCIMSAPSVFEVICWKASASAANSSPHNNIITPLITMTLWLLQNNQETSRKYAAHALGNAITHPAAMDQMSRLDGLHLILDVVASIVEFHHHSLVNNDLVPVHRGTSRYCLLNLTTALRQYVKVEFLLLEEKIKMSLKTNDSRRLDLNASLNLSSQTITAAAITIRKYNRKFKRAILQWPMAELLLEPQHMAALTALVAGVPQLWMPDAALGALEAFEIITLLPQYHQRFLQAISNDERFRSNHASNSNNSNIHHNITNTTPNILEVPSRTEPVLGVEMGETNHHHISTLSSGEWGNGAVGVVLEAAGSSAFDDAFIIVSALRIVCNLVHPGGWCLQPKDHNPAVLIRSPSIGASNIALTNAAFGAAGAAAVSSEDAEFFQGRNAIREGHGIRVLLWRLHIKSPPTSADQIRELACRGLYGLSRLPAVLQMLTSLQICDELSELIKRGPIFYQNRASFERFRLNALELISRTSGRWHVVSDASDTTTQNISRVAVAASTPISYNEVELLQLIHEHLTLKGLHYTANMLLQEAKIHPLAQPLVPDEKPPGSTGYRTPYAIESLPSSSPFRTPSKTRKLRITSSFASNDRVVPIGLGFVTPTADRTERMDSSSHFNTPLQSLPQKPQNNTQPTLDSLVKNYLMFQHMKCKKPTTVLPPFSLLENHRCPRPQSILEVPRNRISVLSARQLGTRWLQTSPNYELTRMHFSNFRSRKIYRNLNGPILSFTFVGSPDISCDLDKCLLVGDINGDIYCHNYYDPDSSTTDPFVVWKVADQPVFSLEASPDLRLLLVGSGPHEMSFREDQGSELHIWSTSHLAKHSNAYEPLRPLRSIDANSRDGSFSHSGERIMTWNEENLSIFNTETGQRTHNILQSVRGKPLIPVWSPEDDLVLCGNKLWDIRRSRLVHRFESLAGVEGNGVFHSNGVEAIINSEIWDLRTFRLLRSCAALDGAEASFSQSGNVIFGVPIYGMSNKELNYGRGSYREPLKSTCFRTVDPRDYSEITTVDVERPILGLELDGFEHFVGVAEERVDMDGSGVSVRLYEIGRKRRDPWDDYYEDDEDDEDEEDEDEDLGDEDEDDDDGFDEDGFDDADDGDEELMMDDDGMSDGSMY